MPVLCVGGNAHGFACLEFPGLLAFDLVVASAAHGDEHLGSTVVDVPVVAASRLEGDVVDGDFGSVKHRCKITLTYEILGEASFGSPIGNALGFSIMVLYVFIEPL